MRKNIRFSTQDPGHSYSCFFQRLGRKFFVTGLWSFASPTSCRRSRNLHRKILLCPNGVLAYASAPAVLLIRVKQCYLERLFASSNQHFVAEKVVQALCNNRCVLKRTQVSHLKSRQTGVRRWNPLIPHFVRAPFTIWIFLYGIFRLNYFRLWQ